MKKYFVLPLLFVLTVFIASCSDNTTNPPAVTETGSIYITSNPSGAQIFIDGQDQGVTTPDSVTGLAAADYNVTLKLTGYRDTTISVTVTANSQSTKFVELTTTLNTTLFGSPNLIRIYETYNTGANEPSGLELSTGTPYGVSSSNADKIDLYYYTNSTFSVHEIRSADSYPGLTRRTFFLAGSSTNLMDNNPSSTYPNGGWSSTMSDNENANYYFIYTEDNHYVKFKVVAAGGGSGPGDPAYLDVEYIYNNTVNDIRF